MTSIASGRSSRRWGRRDSLGTRPLRRSRGGATAATHPLARSGRWLSQGCGRRTRLGPELDRQPVDQPRHIALARRLLDQAVLRGAQSSLQSALPARTHRSRTPGSSAAALSASSRCKMLRFAAGNRGRDRRDRNAAVDPKAGQRQPPRAEMPLLAAARTSSGINRSSAWVAASGWVAGSSSRATRAAADSAGAAVSGSALRPSSRSSASTTLSRPAEPPRQRQPRHPDQRADGLEAQPFERAHCVRIEAQGGDGQRRELSPIASFAAEWQRRMIAPAPRPRRGRRNRDRARSGQAAAKPRPRHRATSPPRRRTDARPR